MNCPTCKSQPLKTGKVKESQIRIDYCARCKGIWLDKDEIDHLLPGNTPELKIPGNAEVAQRCCPKCKCQFRTFVFPNTLVHIDMCPQCQGLWFDQRELKEIQHIQKALSSQKQPAQDYEPTGFKATLINFIDNAISELLSR